MDPLFIGSKPLHPNGIGARKLCFIQQLEVHPTHKSALAIGRPIDPHNLARHPAAIAPAEKGHGVRKLLWLRKPIEWALGRDELEQLLALALVEELRARGPGSNAVDGDAFTGKIFGHDAVHLLNGAFGGVIQEVLGQDSGIDAEGCGQEHDVRAWGHVGNGFLRGWSITRCMYRERGLPGTRNTAL